MGMRIITKYSIGQKIYTIIGFEIFKGIIQEIHINKNKKVEYAVIYNYLDDTQDFSMKSVKAVTYIIEKDDIFTKEEDAKIVLKETLDEIKYKYKTTENFINNDEFTTESRLEIIRDIVRNKNGKLNSLKRIRNER